MGAAGTMGPDYEGGSVFLAWGGGGNLGLNFRE